jgi:hypothetical protein
MRAANERVDRTADKMSPAAAAKWLSDQLRAAAGD